MAETVGIWIAAFLTLCIYSFLYRDNPFYRFAEQLFVGVSAGYWFVYYWMNGLRANLWIPVVHEGHYLPLVAGVLGAMMLTRIVPRYAWMSRWPISFMVGVTAGYSVVTFLQSNFVVQIRGTMVPIGGWGDWQNGVLAVGVLSALIYFFFSKEHKGPFGVGARVGIGFLMVAFGASFGYTVMARISLLIGRMYFLMRDWLHIID